MNPLLLLLGPRLVTCAALFSPAGSFMDMIVVYVWPISPRSQNALILKWTLISVADIDAISIGYCEDTHTVSELSDYSAQFYLVGLEGFSSHCLFFQETIGTKKNCKELILVYGSGLRRTGAFCFFLSECQRERRCGPSTEPISE
ncbi:hypothetical protein C8R44DRAFT_974435 [Mycena epipterygia]|nr:hypothetical protein C8R44DRAFT_974435 [Mycena epipterygia]